MTPFDLYPETVYRRNEPLREHVKIRRIWTHQGQVMLRVHPVNGGRPLVCDVEWFQENFNVVS